MCPLSCVFGAIIWCGDAVKVYLLKLEEEKIIVKYFFGNFIDFLQLQKVRRVAGS